MEGAHFRTVSDGRQNYFYKPFITIVVAFCTKDEVRATCSAYCDDIVCLVETWLCSNIQNTELYVPGYSVIRLDRNRHGGGVMIYVSDSSN